MKTLKSAAALFAMLCLMASCNKEEPQACDCSAAKPNKQTLLGLVQTTSKGELTILIPSPTIQTHIICNQTHFRNLLKQTAVRKDSVVKLEVYGSETCDNKKNSGFLGIKLTFLDVISVKQDTIK
jgi:hypothetical protein